MNMIVNILLFLFMMSLIIVIHEFGHLIAAKIFGVYCHEFSLGMGPKLFSKKGKETEYSVRAIPIGGFVAMAGDTDNALETSVDIEVPAERTLTGIKPIKRIIIMLGGIVMNLLLAEVVISLLLLGYGKYAMSPEPYIESVVEDYPAAKAGLRANDLIVGIEYENGSSYAPASFSELSDFLATYESGTIVLTIERDKERLDFEVEPVKNDSGSYVIGITGGSYAIVEVNILNCWYYGFIYLKEVMKLLITTVIGLFKGIGLKNLSGPIGIYNATSEAASMGADIYFNLLAVLSLNIGIMNAIPLPVLDGGRVVLTLVEMVIGHPISKKVTDAIMTISILLLIMLMVFATGQDLWRLFN